LVHCYLQNKLQSKYSGKEVSVTSELKSAGFKQEMIQHNVNGLHRLVESLTWNRNKSEWADYADHTSYTKEEQAQKAEFVSKAVHSRKWRLVWDLGCNTGVYSQIAAQNSSYVVAMDADHLSVDRLYRELRTSEVKNILPLVMNVTDASPNLGWRGSERMGLKERGKPDLILCLALIHHIVISNNIPMRDFLEWISMQCSALVIEFVTKNDPMVKRLLLNKFDNYYDYEQPFFQKCLNEYFTTVATESIPSGTRTLYFATSKRSV
jgi:precorrin-6B methylase 2